MVQEQRLIVIDGNSLMHRAYYALPSMTTKQGQPTGAVFGFVSMLLKLLEYQPSHMLVAFDMHGPTFRHNLYTDYKAGRRETPEDMRPQFPLLKELLGKMGIAVCECEGYEADDILGTFSRIANAQGVDALLVTGDRDALQLVNAGTHVLMTRKGISETVEYDEAALMEQYGLKPENMPDLKGLMGDSSDNLPGIPGVGEKTALKLLAKYGSMQATLENAANEKGALREKLESNVALAEMSYKLGLIDTGVPVRLALEDCAFRPESLSNAIPMMSALELRSLISRLPQGETAPHMPQESFAQVETQRVGDMPALMALVEAVRGAKRLAIHADQSLYLATDANPQKQYEVQLNATLLDEGLDEAQVFAALEPLLGDAQVEKYVFDSKRLRHALARYGVALAGVVFDAMIADYLLHAIHPADSLATLCTERGAQAGAAALLFLGGSMLQELRDKGMDALYKDIELPLTHVLFDMEREGFKVDMDMLEQLGVLFQERIGQLEKEIYALSGEVFNILSPKQLGVVLFEKLELPAQRKTKSGFSTDAEVLEKLSEMHPVVPLVMEYRNLTKLKSTFVDALWQKARLQDGRVRTTFNQNVTATGRISSTEPNLQNIPVRTELGREIRKAFVASEGNQLVGADYSQIELRLLAHMSGDAAMIAAFKANADIHTVTAAEVFGAEQSDVTQAQRSAAKAVNFGIVYGISDFGLARNIGVSRKEAADYIEGYFRRYPGVRAYMDEAVKRGREDGYVSTLMGRRRELPEITSSNYNTRQFGERVAMNMPIQGTAADIIKLAMVRTQSALEANALRAKLILQVHDELIVDAPEDEVERVAALLEECMQNVVSLAVPLTVEVKTGRRWFDTK